MKDVGKIFVYVLVELLHNDNRLSFVGKVFVYVLVELLHNDKIFVYVLVELLHNDNRLSFLVYKVLFYGHDLNGGY